MNRPARPRIRFDEHLWIVSTDDGSATLFDEQVGDTFHSESGAAAESRSVFLFNSGVASRLQSGQATRVLEIGFGTGLNFLLTADLALRHHASLDYWGCDTRIISPELLRQLGYERWVAHPELKDRLAHWLENFATMNAGETRSCRFGAAQLHVHRGDVRDWSLPSGFDAIYFDAFSPRACPELWTTEVFGRLFDTVLPGGTLATYCCRRAVQDALREVGFELNKIPGPVGGKREVLVARKPTSLAR